MKIRSVARLIFAGVSLISATSCSCEAKLKRIQDRCPELFKTITLRVTDTITPTPVRIEETVAWEELWLYDTLILEQRQYTMQLIIDTERILISAEVYPDTIYIDSEQTVYLPDSASTKRSGHSWIRKFCIIITLVVLTGTIGRIASRHR